MNMVTASPASRARTTKLLPEGFPAQLIDGCLVKEPSPTYGHQWVLGRVYRALALLVGDRAVPAPIDVGLDDWNVFQPDVVVLSGVPDASRHDVGVPLLAVEVLSSGTARLDRAAKLPAPAPGGRGRGMARRSGERIRRGPRPHGRPHRARRRSNRVRRRRGVRARPAGAAAPAAGVARTASVHSTGASGPSTPARAAGRLTRERDARERERPADPLLPGDGERGTRPGRAPRARTSTRAVNGGFRKIVKPVVLAGRWRNSQPHTALPKMVAKSDR